MSLAPTPILPRSVPIAETGAETEMRCNQKILIVDDERRMCDSLKALLSTQGYEIKTCDNGRDALKCLAEQSMDLLLLDLAMAQMDGFQVMERMTSRHLDIPVIIITGNASTASAIDALRKGACDYLRKPFEPEDLFKSVKNALDQARLKNNDRLMKRKLQESEERFRRLAENAKVLIYRMSLPDGHYEYVSPASIDLVGYTPAEFYASPMFIRKIIHPNWSDFFEEKWKELLSGDMPADYEYQVVHKSGEEKWVHQRNVLIRKDSGQPKAIEGVVSDITDRKQAEAEQERLQTLLMHAQKMEAIGTLAGGIAHNFNNVLMAIQGRVSLMLLDKDPHGPDFEHLKCIEDYIKNAAGLTKNLLDFARSGKYEVSPTNLNEFITHESRLFLQTKKEIRFHGKYEKDLWAVEIVHDQMKQVLMNLYVNAWQAMPKGGDLYVRTENVTLDEDHVNANKMSPGRYVKLSVTDTGAGMDETTRKKIFIPFFSTQKTGQGYGLGLASVYGILKNHGGYIEVLSKQGEGTTFTLFLPASDKEINEETILSEEIVKGEGTILLVDDEEIIIDVGKKLLEILGYDVLIARDGKEAVTIFKDKNSEIDLVILDMIMPGMGGAETYDRLKEISPGSKVLLSSGYAFDSRAQDMLGRGCDGFIRKPFGIKEISQKISEVLTKAVNSSGVRR